MPSHLNYQGYHVDVGTPATTEYAVPIEFDPDQAIVVVTSSAGDHGRVPNPMYVDADMPSLVPQQNEECGGGDLNRLMNNDFC